MGGYGRRSEWLLDRYHKDRWGEFRSPDGRLKVQCGKVWSYGVVIAKLDIAQGCVHIEALNSYSATTRTHLGCVRMFVVKAGLVWRPTTFAEFVRVHGPYTFRTFAHGGVTPNGEDRWPKGMRPVGGWADSAPPTDVGVEHWPLDRSKYRMAGLLNTDKTARQMWARLRKKIKFLGRSA